MKLKRKVTTTRLLFYLHSYSIYRCFVVVQFLFPLTDICLTATFVCMSGSGCASSSSSGLEVPTLLPRGSIGRRDPVAFIDPKTGEGVSANSLVLYNVPFRITDRNVKKVPVRLQNGKVVQQHVLPVCAPNGKVVREISCGPPNGFRPGHLHMEQVSADFEPYTFAEHQMAYTMRELHEKGEYFRPLKKHRVDQMNDERVERLEALGSLPEDGELAPGSEEASQKFEEKKHIALTKARDEIGWVWQAFQYEKNEKAIDIEMKHAIPAKATTAQEDEREDEDTSLAIELKREQVASAAEYFRGKVAGLRNNLRQNRFYFQAVAYLAKHWPLLPRNERQAFSSIKAIDRLCVDCSNSLRGSLWKPTRGKEARPLQNATLVRLVHTKNVEREDEHLFTVGGVAPKICAFVSLEVKIGKGPAHVFSPKLPRDDNDDGGNVPQKTKLLLESVRHSALCEEIFDLLKSEMGRRIYGRKKMDLSELFSRDNFSVVTYLDSEISFMGEDIDSPIVSIRLVPLEEGLGQTMDVEDDDGNVVGAASVAAILCTEVKHNWKLQVEGAEYHRNKDGTKVFRLGSRKPFTGAENAMRYLKHVSLRREVNDLLAHCTNSKTWESSIEDTTKDLLDRRANGGSALCVSICHFSVKATHKGTFAIRDSHDIQLMLVDSSGKCMSREFARVVEVREFFNNQLKWKTKK